VLLHLDEAFCALTAGEPGQAAATAAVTLAAVPAERRTTVVTRRAEELAQALSRYHAVSEVRDFNNIRATWPAMS
jgi:hypothetical protein